MLVYLLARKSPLPFPSYTSYSSLSGRAPPILPSSHSSCSWQGQPASLLSCTHNPTGGRTQLHSLPDLHQLCRYAGVFVKQPLPQRVARSLPVGPCSSVLSRTISLKREREGGRKGRMEKQSRAIFIPTQKYEQFNLSLLCTLLAATGLGFAFKPSGNTQRYTSVATWPQVHKQPEHCSHHSGQCYNSWRQP